MWRGGVKRLLLLLDAEPRTIISSTKLRSSNSANESFLPLDRAARTMSDSFSSFSTFHAPSVTQTLASLLRELMEELVSSLGRKSGIRGAGGQSA